ncbi:MAG: 3-dehydroquinate synthase [Planctomycetota bacterium]
MRVLKIKGRYGKSNIILGESITNLGKYCPSGKTVIITDRKVRNIYGNLFPAFDVIEIGAGEQSKTLDTAANIYKKFLELEVDRTSFVVGIGGGIVCDVTGFAASTYMRGIRFGFVPTTLLAQADASIGGKNGVNFMRYKNIIGAFNQPQFVLCDFRLLKTLQMRELKCGFAEIIKHAAIGDSALFAYLEKNRARLLSLPKDVIEKVLYNSVSVKAKIVSIDETEQSERRKLNFGHTFGHAIEKTAHIPHGEAISIGMTVAAKLSVFKGLLTKEDAHRIEALLRALDLPTRITADKNAVVDAIKKDKKRYGAKINFALLEGIGKAKIVGIKLTELESVANDLR